MKLLGVEIRRAKEAAEPKTTKKGLVIGDSGTRILDGIISEEYNTKLNGATGIEVYDEMRKSDGAVRAAVQAVTLPIRAAEWYIKPASEDAADKAVADFVTEELFNNPSFTFDDFLRQALLSLPFGVMVFEKVFTTRDVDGTTRIVWDKLGARMPRSIQKWAIGGGKLGILQNRSDGQPVEIPFEKLIVFVNEMEGDNWWGTSILRAAYKHWYIKNTFYKIDAIAFERQGLGIPSGTLPDNYTERDRSTMESILKNMRANSQSYVIKPKDYEIAFMDMMARTTRDPQSSIAHHNREIMKCVLAQFLELGSTDAGGTGGSRALSEDHSDLFLQSIESIARSIASTFTRQAVKELVDLNFEGVKQYPSLDFEGITADDVQALSTAYQTLRGAGGLTAQDADEAYLRKLLGLPELDEQGVREEKTTNVPVDPNNPNPGTQQPDNKQPPKKNASEHTHGVKKNFSDGFKAYRKLTFAEEKVDFDKLQQKMDELESQFDQATKNMLHDARDEYMAAFTKAAHAGDTQAIKDATLKVQSDYARIIKNAGKSAFEYGKNNAAKEIGVGAPPNPSDLLRQIDIQADTIADAHITEIISDSKQAYVQALNKGLSVTAALAAADAAAEAAIDALTDDTGGILLSAYINHGRNEVFDRNSADVHALQRSEILDEVTCNYCMSIDGRIIEKDDAFGQNTIFHSNCRGIWVAILKDEEELPKISGIPQSLRDRFGDAVNDLIQPKSPITRKRS
jgi:phage gp29-like protein